MYEIGHRIDPGRAPLIPRAQQALGARVQRREIEFVIARDDGVWKIYRDGELIVPFPSFELADDAAHRFAAEIARFGGTAVVRTMDAGSIEIEFSPT